MAEELTFKLIKMPEDKLRLVVWENQQVIDIIETGDTDPRSVRMVMNQMLRRAYIEGFTAQEYAVRTKG